MPPRANPYHFGSPVDELHFTDREEELRRLTTVMLNHQNLVLIAPRRYGKSSLLRRAVAQVEEQGGRSGRVSLMRCASERDVAEALLRGVLAGPLSWLQGRAQELAQHLRHLRFSPELRFDAGSGAVVGASLGASLAAERWSDVIADVLRLLEGAGGRGHPVSMVLDEFQKAYEISPNIPDLMKDLVDELPRVSFIFAGSKRHLMEAMVTDPEHGALYNVGHKLYLGRIPEADFAAYLVDRARAGGKRLSPEVAGAVYRAAMGVPNDVQFLAFWAFESSGSVIDEAALGLAVRTAVADSKAEFEARFDALGLSQQRLLKLLARQPLEHLKGQEAQMELGISHTSVDRAAEALRRTELIEFSDGRWRVASGLLREWLLGDLEQWG